MNFPWFFPPTFSIPYRYLFVLVGIFMSTNLFSVGSPSENPGDLGSNLGRLVLYPSSFEREKSGSRSRKNGSKSDPDPRHFPSTVTLLTYNSWRVLGAVKGSRLSSIRLQALDQLRTEGGVQHVQNVTQWGINDLREGGHKLEPVLRLRVTSDPHNFWHIRILPDIKRFHKVKKEERKNEIYSFIFSKMFSLQKHRRVLFHIPKRRIRNSVEKNNTGSNIKMDWREESSKSCLLFHK